MKYFENVTSYENLKSQYRKLATSHHPDAGGDAEVMKAINNEYDMLFVVWKNRSKVTTNETAASTRREFYTQYGWKGENYNINISLKEIACIIREFVKTHYNHCKFSITTEYASMCQELHISLMESPYRAYKTFDELGERDELNRGELSQVIRKYTDKKNINSYFRDEICNIIRPIYDKDLGAEEGIYFPKFLTEEVKQITKAVEEYANSFNYDDSDSQIDYFDKNFYFFGVNIGKWDKEYKIVERAKKEVEAVEYENVEIKKTRTYKTLEPRDIATPAEFAKGQFFQLKSNFTYGARKGYVYQIDDVREFYIQAYKMGKGYKNMLTGNIAGNNFCPNFDKLKTWLEKGAISFVELVEVTKTEEYTSVVRRPKKQTGVSTVVSKQEQPEANPSANGKAYTIFEDIDTRDNSPLWVLKLQAKLNPEDYKVTAAAIKKMGGYWSRFKRGFIFKNEPTIAKIEAALS